LGASCSGSAFSAPVVSVSMSVVLSGAKKLRVLRVHKSDYQSKSRLQSHYIKRDNISSHSFFFM
jgi:hypothetical protein